MKYERRRIVALYIYRGRLWRNQSVAFDSLAPKPTGSVRRIHFVIFFFIIINAIVILMHIISYNFVRTRV